MIENNALTSRDEQIVRKLLTETKPVASARQRLKLISAHFIGLPYIAHPLNGSPEISEELVARLDGFDCVTYVETVLALATSRGADEFLNHLREIRYENGQVEWRKRLHYPSDWSSYNVRRGFLRNMTEGEGTVVREKTLDFVAGLPSKIVSIRYFPKEEFGYVSRWLIDGDILFFVSARRNLDIFHVGMAFRDGDRLLMRHARQMRHRVFEQPLEDFVRVIKSPGFIVNRLAKD